MTLISRAREKGEIKAARELVRLKVDQSQPINIFSVIEQAGIWLLFQPLKDLQGVYLKDSESGRHLIVINSRRPLSLQRLTAAHEYGHHVLGHEASLDHAADVEPSDTHIAQEAAAQTFANDFLMPPQLVNTQWNSLELPTQPRLLQAHQAYLLSLYLGVSYRALIYQLIALRRIDKPTANRLAKYQPRQIKQLIGRGIGPLDSFADIWPLAQEDNGRQIQTRVNDEVNIALPEIPSTGYRWTITSPQVTDLSTEIAASQDKMTAKTILAARISPGIPLALLSDDFDGASSRDDYAGSGGHRYLNFRIAESGDFVLRLDLIRPWQSQGASVGTFEVKINSTRQTTGDVGNGPREEVKQGLAHSLTSGQGE